ncbi:MAG: hypothetical protein F4X72_09555 [Dehalococcoidia bacterium]|nr:hypothetical protein [Dehalococcoidia bacterium]
MNTTKPLYMVSSVALQGCLRCGGPLNLYDRFPRCINCGWEDYREPDSQRNADPLGSSCNAESFPDRVAYRGESRRFAFADRMSARIASTWRDTTLLCPYDGAVMRHTGPAGANTPTVHAYTCRDKKHRVRLWRQSDGDLAWR